jgi:hypothetical protein
MLVLALLLAAALPAKLVIIGHPQNTVVTYPTMERCLAAKAELERQYEATYRRDIARGIMRTPPEVYCLPG